jgi:hypothetical protein
LIGLLVLSTISRQLGQSTPFCFPLGLTLLAGFLLGNHPVHQSVRPDLNNFYASLSDEQKARFNTMGPPPNAGSSPQQRQSGQR